MKHFAVKYRQYGPTLDGGSHVYVENVMAKTSRGAIGQIKREAKETWGSNSEYRVEIISTVEVPA